jgi:putative spermidine/putrescine transport system substrate-binding protein
MPSTGDIAMLISMNRRRFLGTTAATAGLLAAPSLLRAETGTLKIGVYGGFF